MGLSLRTNIPSLQAQTELNRTTAELSAVMGRLASGLRINTAADDPAGLALANKLEADGRVATVAIRNANDGLSLTTVTDTGLGEIQGILNRMAELATQSSNGVYTNTQRSALSSEFLALGSEVDRIARATTFNGMNLLYNSQNVTVQVGTDGSANSQITIQAVNGTLNALGLCSNTAGSVMLTYSIIDTTSTGAAAAAGGSR